MFTFRKNGHFYEKIGKKGEPICIDAEIPFEVPINWELCRLENLCSLLNPKIGENGKYPYLNAKFLRNKTDPEIKEKGRFIQTNTKVILVDGENSGEVFLTHEDGYMGSTFRLLDINSQIYDKYILKLIELWRNPLKKSKKGAAIPHLNKDIFNNIFVGIPPFNEQKRIVNQINSLMPLINEYGNYKEKLDKLNSEFSDKLKSSILQEAIQGKLVPQNPNDEPASVLLERIRDEKERLIKEKKIKRNNKESFIYKNNNHFYEIVGKKGEPICIDDEIPFEIPENWEWTRIKNIVTKLTDGAHKTPKYVDKGIPFLSVKDMSSGYLDFSDTKYISQEDFERIYQRCNYEYGDILLTKVGTTGIPIIIDTNKDFGLFVSVALLKFNHEFIHNEFLVHLINSPLVQLQCIENTKGVGNKNWVLRDIGNTLITLPPLNEQIRIVEKLEEIFQKFK